MAYEILAQMIEDHKGEIIEQVISRVHIKQIAKYSAMPFKELAAKLENLIDSLSRYICETDANEYRNTVRETTELRLSEGFSAEAVMAVGRLTIIAVHKTLVRELDRRIEAEPELIQAKAWLIRRMDGTLTMGQSTMIATEVKQVMNNHDANLDK